MFLYTVSHYLQFCFAFCLVYCQFGGGGGGATRRGFTPDIWLGSNPPGPGGGGGILKPCPDDGGGGGGATGFGIDCIAGGGTCCHGIDILAGGGGGAACHCDCDDGGGGGTDPEMECILQKSTKQNQFHTLLITQISFSFSKISIVNVNDIIFSI
jgi:hypothetical protein